MNKFYKAIEEKIKASGYPREISGRGVYNDICDQIEGILTMRTPEGVFQTDFDE